MLDILAEPVAKVYSEHVGAKEEVEHRASEEGASGDVRCDIA